jgi:hypothetical protein
VKQIIVSKKATDPVSLGLERQRRGLQEGVFVKEEQNTDRSQGLGTHPVSPGEPTTPELKERFEKIRARFDSLKRPWTKPTILSDEAIVVAA